MADEHEPEWIRREFDQPHLRAVKQGEQPELEPFPGQVYADLREEEWGWLWRGKFPLGEVSYLEGYAGDGKSSVLADIAARTTTGLGMPDESEQDASSGGVLWFTTEESPTKTILRRLRIAGARMERVVNIDVTKIDADKRGLPRFRFPSGRERLSTSVKHYGARMGLPVKLLVIDGVFSVFDDDFDPFKPHHVRAVLGALRQVAIEHNLAIICVRHPSKSQGGLAQHRAGGSTAWNDFARMSWLVGQEPGTDWKDYRRVLVPVKQNAGRAASGMKFHTQWDEQAHEVEVCWDGPCELSSDEVYAARESKKQPKATDDQVSAAVAELRQHDVSKLTPAKAKRAVEGLGLPADAALRAYRKLLEERRGLMRRRDPAESEGQD